MANYAYTMPTMRLQDQVTYGLRGASAQTGADTAGMVSSQPTKRILDTFMSRAPAGEKPSGNVRARKSHGGLCLGCRNPVCANPHAVPSSRAASLEITRKGSARRAKQVNIRSRDPCTIRMEGQGAQRAWMA